MRRDERLNFAWRLVLTTDLSKAQISNVCNVGTSTVTNMRRKAKEADGRIGREELARQPWELVSKLSIDELLSREPKQRSRENGKADQQKAEEIAQRIIKTLGTERLYDTEAFARALLILEDRLPVMLMHSQAWADDRDYLREAMLNEGE